MKILPTETLLTGKWVKIEGGIIGDETCNRIEQLVTGQLIKLGHDDSGWETLYRDPDDNRLWEKTYPQGELQSGGPPQLQCLSIETAKEKYRSLVLQ